LFWQSNPFGWKWANMYWGHAISKDLIHWQQLPYALYPRVMAVNHCFSGSANVDEHNTSQWQTGKDKVIVAAFTDTGCGEALAVSNDRGRTWKYIDENPVIEHRGRDPKLVWYQYGETDTPLNDVAKRQGGHWVIAVYDEHDEHGRNIAFYTSVDLKEWQEQSHLPGYFECPELFQLPVDGAADESRWVTFAADAQYAIGKFDGKVFTPEHEGKHRVHYGAYYASQCFSRVPDGRVVQIGWARVDMPEMPFNQAFSLPCELRLKKTADGIRLCAQPIKELETLRGEPLTVARSTLGPEEPIRLAAEGQLFDIIVEVKPMEAETIQLKFGESLVKYDVRASKLDEMPLPLVEGKVKFRVVVDRPMYEVCGGHGDVYKTAPRADGGKPIDSIQLSAFGGEAQLETFNVYPLRSIWKN
jgi:fructan beta-fructosidase